jgi:hypothetical protein
MPSAHALLQTDVKVAPFRLSSVEWPRLRLKKAAERVPPSVWVGLVSSGDRPNARHRQAAVQRANTLWHFK